MPPRSPHVVSDTVVFLLSLKLCFFTPLPAVGSISGRSFTRAAHVSVTWPERESEGSSSPTLWTPSRFLPAYQRHEDKGEDNSCATTAGRVRRAAVFCTVGDPASLD
jgi:hypothetical protein